MSAPPAEKLQELHELLESADSNEDYDKIIKLSDEFLKADSKDPEINRCNIVASIMKEDYKGAISKIQKMENFKKSYAFELIYCYYQLKRNDKALAFMNDVPDRNKTKGFWHVQAQLLRRVGKIEEATGVYEKQFISKKARMAGENAKEIRANYLACLSEKDPKAAISFAEKLDDNLWTYAIALNVASPYLETANISKATNALSKASDLCKKEIEAEGGDRKEIESELEGVRMMMGYVAHVNGDEKKAEEVYRGLLKSDQIPIAAGVRLNLLQIKEGNGSDCEKWARSLANYPLSKLSERQRSIARLNHCLTLFKGKRSKEQGQIYDALKRKFPGSEIPALSYASILFTDGGKDGSLKAEEILKSWISDNPDSSLETQIALSTLYFSQRKVQPGVDTLSGLKSEYAFAPGIVGTMVRWLRKTGKLEQAAEKLDNAVAFWKESKEPQAAEYVNELKSAGADLKAKLGDFKAAGEAYEMMAQKSGDATHISGVVANAVEYDMELAQKYASKLPELDLSSLDIDALEALGEGGDDMMVEEVESKKKKRKRKKRLPKNYDPEETPDPERWLPKWERSYFKRGRGKRRNKNQLRGPQGGAVRADLASSLDKTREPAEEDKKKPPVAPKLSARDRRRMKKKKGKR